MATQQTCTLSWKWKGLKQVVCFVNLDDAKMCAQALQAQGIPCGFSRPEGYQELPLRRYEGDGILSNEEMATLKKLLDKMTIVG